MEMLKEILDYIKEFLEYKLVSVSGHELTVFNLLLIIFIFFGVRLLNRAIIHFFKKRISPKYEIDEGKAFSILQLIKYFLYVIAVVVALESLGIDLSILLAGSAALLVGLGLGIQEVFKDIVSGLILLFEGSLKVGDVIEIDDLVGVVKEINIRTSKVRTRDGIIIIVPNSNFITDKVINWSNSSKLTRFKVTVGVAYGSDVQKVRELLIECARKTENISTRPKPFVRFTEFSDSSLVFDLYFWSERVWTIENTRSDLRFAVGVDLQEEQDHHSIPTTRFAHQREIACQRLLR